MDPDKQDALNSIENSIYRTAFKLRSVQSLCQLDLIDSSLIQRFLLDQSLWEVKAGCLSVQQLSQALQELFRQARLERPGQVHPRASDLTLSLLMALYDSTGTGFLKRVPAAAALTALASDCPLTKYRALFQLYAENNRGGYDSGARMTRRALRSLLTDLQQIPTVVGESRASCSVESAIRSCFQGVLSPAIKEEKFLSWLQTEPPILLWLPTCYRLSATEMATHPVCCGICRTFPITGPRFRCLKCLNFDICQACFLAGLNSESHQKSHPVIEHRVQMSAKENTKQLLRSLRNNLLQRRCRREAARKNWLPGSVNAKGVVKPAPAASKLPMYGSPTGPAATEDAKQRVQRISQAHQVKDGRPHHLTIVSIRNELWRTRKSITALHKERRLLKKQLNRYKDKLQAIYASQEERSYRLETKIHELTTNQDSLWNKLQQMGQDLQAMLQPFHPSSSSCLNMISKSDHGKSKNFCREGDSSQIKNTTENGSKLEPLSNHNVIDKSHPNQAKAELALPKSESPETFLQLRSRQNTGAQSPTQKPWKTNLISLPNSKEVLPQDTSGIAPAEMSSPQIMPAERKEAIHTHQEENELKEEELKELLSKLMDAFTLEMPSGPQSSVNTELYCGADRVCRAFSALVDQITFSNLK
ncbi:PREDICTED: dystrotelin [Condylura cristata]|uniref:dystrotelin n=1 Tax=Condylura cristata TaxID=143302 RepID=UPI000642A789|nr:PREDICTED: dystrotelin [Condylura cristata]